MGSANSFVRNDWYVNAVDDAEKTVGDETELSIRVAEATLTQTSDRIH
jgi:hypothetical protein